MKLRAGQALGPYEILSRLGSGGMGDVWKARDTRLDRIVAIKTSSEAFSDRFAREARAVAALNHPHICTLYDVGPDYLVMEYVEGAELKGPLPLETALKYCAQLASALEAAHVKGTTHRDLKPANVLLSSAGVKLLDFGLAKVRSVPTQDDATEAMPLTKAGMIMGTVPYMSPEQAKGEEVDSRSDVFSFGVVMYEVLSGRRAFDAGSVVETLAAVLYDEPSPVQAPDDVRQLVERCMRKATVDRFQTMGEVREALERCSSVLASRQSPAEASSIAVLPFANLSADKENEYFSDGLAEDILNLLARTDGLKVIARTSSFAFRGREQDITTIAAALRVRHVLEGSVRRSGNRIRVTAQLVQASDGAQLWSERFDGDMTDVFAIQDEIGQAIADALRVRLAPRQQAVSVEAWEHWLKGVHYRARNTPDSVDRAKEQFDRALAIDPSYAQAYSGLALCHYVLALMGVRPLEEMKLLARQAAEKALAIDPNDSDSHMVLAVMAGVFDFDWTTASRSFQKALAGEHVSPRARFTHAVYFLVPAGRTAEAVEQSQMALRMDPLSPLFHFGVVWCLHAAGRHREALEAAREASIVDAGSHLVLFATAFAQLASGATHDAVASFRRYVEQAPWERRGRGSLAAALHLDGDRAGARLLASDRPAGQLPGLGEAAYHAAAGELDAMFEALHAACEQRDLYVSSFDSIPLFQAFRADPRYSALLRRMNLA
ncbi:MAG: serine/threonine protein kinase [Gemmatimonadetes bacterium]|nr:serine/threonine protein kinase [Gemmatimonadota bacterium]